MMPQTSNRRPFRCRALFSSTSLSDNAASTEAVREEAKLPSTYSETNPINALFHLIARVASAGMDNEALEGASMKHSNDYSQFSNWYSENELAKLKMRLDELRPAPNGATMHARRFWVEEGAGEGQSSSRLPRHDDDDDDDDDDGIGSTRSCVAGNFRVPLQEGHDPGSGVRWTVRLTHCSEGISLPGEAVEVGSVLLYVVLWGRCSIATRRGGSTGPLLSERQLPSNNGLASVYQQQGGPVRVITGEAAAGTAILEVILRPARGGGVGVMTTSSLAAVADASNFRGTWLPLRPDLEPQARALFDEDDDRKGPISGDGGAVAYWRRGNPRAAQGGTEAKLARPKRVLDGLWNPAALDDFVGGLDAELEVIVRRVLATRTVDPAIAAKMGVQNVRGLLLYGPPGCGKTLLARQLASALDAVEVKVVSGPEVLNKFVGTSEERIRELFANAEKEWNRFRKGLQARAGLHVIIFDELDAICRQRGSLSGDTSGVRDSVVNQLLAKLDGVTEVGNVLVVGMTNRRDLIDDAMLRPGRLEVHVEVKLPDSTGRRQILQIHARKMIEQGFISAAAWEGTITQSAEATFTSDSAPTCSRNSSSTTSGGGGILDLLVRKTEGFSGAEIAGLVRAASSFAVARHIESVDGVMAGLPGGEGAEGEESDWRRDAAISVTREDFLHGLREMEPQLELVRQRRRRSVAALLRDASLPQYENALCREHEVGWEELLRIDDAQLKECGITKVGHRIKILAAVAREAPGG